ncbi:hypothetical protein [Niabella sp.]|uniref:hypothetical protein n=1 Tax=Niabella sp. TaxID=1962976 RepID=UPI002607828B|nr:hypothetical protein [Niabella sp.]
MTTKTNAPKVGKNGGRTPGSGRAKGTPNKATVDLREFVTSFIAANATNLQKEFNKMSPAQKFAAFEKLLSYALPKPQQMELHTSLDKISDSQIDALFLKIVNQ